MFSFTGGSRWMCEEPEESFVPPPSSSPSPLIFSYRLSDAESPILVSFPFRPPPFLLSTLLRGALSFL
jgi:hypothetical protein